MGILRDIQDASRNLQPKVLSNSTPIIDIEAGATHKYGVDAVAYNSDVTGWGKDVLQQLKSSIRQLSKEGKGELVKSLRLRTRTDYGLIDRITFNFRRHGVFWHKGVGKGQPISGKVLTSGGIKRQPAEWFNPVIERNINKLADIVASYMAQAAVNATRMKIN